MNYSKRGLLGVVAGTVLGVGVFVGPAWASVPTTGPAAGPSPGYGQDYVGSCHGVFGDYFGYVSSTSGTGFSYLAPLGNMVGQSNAVGSCPYNGIPAPVFPPR